ncbi:hypothetical protein [Kocuria rosea]|uniref:hypothetical protein n=1 Tax=Kocuria rosea TaxID=1275 RepID=UPI0011A32B03|nr:hypothetical protein [Kocuria rosea]
MAKNPPPETSPRDIFEEAQRIERELTNQSDRHVALIGALAVENDLGKILAMMLVDGVLPNSGKQFLHKMEWTYRLGLISAEERREIDLIRMVRNKMAHELDKHSFEEPEVKELCNKLTYCERFYIGEGLVDYLMQWEADQDEHRGSTPSVPPKEYVVFPYGDDPRRRFIGSVKALVSVLGVRKLLAQREPVTSPMSFEHGGALFDGKNQGLRNALGLLPPERQDQWRQFMHQPLLNEYGLVNLIAVARAYYKSREARE